MTKNTNNSRRKFLEKGSAAALTAGVVVASGKITMASQPNPSRSTRELLQAVIEGQRKINGRLYAANELLLEVLSLVIPHIPIDLAAATAKLAKAEGYLAEVPGYDPPGCELPAEYP